MDDRRRQSFRTGSRQKANDLSGLTRDQLLASVRELFAPDRAAAGAYVHRIGAELEMIPVMQSTGERVHLRSSHPSSEQFIADLAREHGWREEPMGMDPSCWSLDAGRITFEPGGQIELSSAVFPNANELLHFFDTLVPLLQRHANTMGIELRTIGIEDSVPIERVPLQLKRERYVRMTEYFQSIGPFGILMMRQTASLQINVDKGADPLQRWRLLNALVPYLIAIFANSRRYAGSETGHQSYRAHIWRNLDSRRTGIVYDSGNEAERYLQFALDAPVIMDREFRTFAEIMNEAKRSEWDTHLSTLFPEIRPRDYFEIRSIDSLPLEHLSAAIAFVAGIVYNPDSAAAALSLLGHPDETLLVRAGVEGLRAKEIALTATQLARLALEGCSALGADYFSAGNLAQAARFFEKFTFRGMSPSSLGSDSSISPRS